MIDPKELHIGSHVMVDGVRARVTDIESNYEWRGDTLLSVVAVIDGEKRTRGAFSQNEGVEPIPITAELLEELGFEYRDNTYWEHWFLGGFDIERKEDSKYFDYDGEIRLEYLHELENLYYLIYGEELIKD